VSQPLTVICGPTASGKSALAIALAERTGAEIVSADSQQVYRHFDLGTAKPTPEELRRVPHHLISVVEPTEAFSAGRYQALADAAITGIAERDHPAIVVGGTGLYVRVLLHGMIPTPDADASLRARLLEEVRLHGAEALHARLSQIDPATAASVRPTDALRITRALEIHALTGRSVSEQRSEHRFAEQRYPYELFILDPPRDALYAAIDDRTQKMFAAGLVGEVERLVQRGFADAPPMRSVGYAQALRVLRGTLSEADAVTDTARQTRRYAKRQLTWFRKEQGARWISPPYAELRPGS
jgi:tRNA dimethylallyltransferase